MKEKKPSYEQDVAIVRAALATGGNAKALEAFDRIAKQTDDLITMLFHQMAPKKQDIDN
jgi:hypothetical protein